MFEKINWISLITCKLDIPRKQFPGTRRYTSYSFFITQTMTAATQKKNSTCFRRPARHLKLENWVKFENGEHPTLTSKCHKTTPSAKTRHYQRVEVRVLRRTSIIWYGSSYIALIIWSEPFGWSVPWSLKQIGRTQLNHIAKALTFIRSLMFQVQDFSWINTKKRFNKGQKDLPNFN